MLARLVLSCAALGAIPHPAPQAPAAPPQAAASDDPKAEFLAKLEKRLKSHPFFRRTTLTRLDDYAPFAVYVEALNRDTKGYEARIGAKYGPWLVRLESSFRRDYVEPLGLVDHGAVPVHVLIVLNSHGSYVNYGDATGSLDPNAVRAHYDPELKIAVTYEDEIREAAEHTERAAALHEIVHALQHRYGPSRDRLPACVWFNEGLAEYLSFHLLSKPEDLDLHRVDRYALGNVANAVRAGVPAELALLPAAVLIEPGNYGEVAAASLRRSSAVGVAIDASSALGLFYAQSSLFAHFLHQGKSGAYRERFGRAMKATMTGKPPANGFTEAFEGIDLAALDVEFRAHFLEQYASQFPGESIEDLRAAFSSSGAIAASSPASAPAASLESVRASLALGATESDARVGRALARAVLGDFEGGIRDLSELRAGASAELAPRVDVELGRMTAWKGARDRFLADLARAKQPLRIEVGGKKLALPVASIESGSVRFAVNASRIEAIAIVKLAPDDLLQAMPKELFAGEHDWLRLYPYALLDNPKWKRLSAAGKEADALRADAERFYPQALRVGRAALALEEIETSVGSGGAARVDGIRALWAEHATVPCVASRSRALQLAASIELRERAQGLGAAELVHGRVESTGADAIRLSYDFHDAQHALDFARDDGYLAGLRQRLPKVSFADPSTELAFRGSALAGNGSICYRHLLDFAAPMRARYSVRVETLPGVPNESAVFAVGICGDDYERNIQCVGSSALLVDDKGAGAQSAELTGDGRLRIGASYSIELRHDGSVVEVWIDGELRGKAAAGGCKSGRAFLWIQSDLRVVFSAVELEGRVTPASLERCRERWVDGQVRSLGIP